MNPDIQDTLALFAENAQVIGKDFAWQNSEFKRLSALLYALQGRQVDCGAIRECQNLMKASTGMFSAFRGNLSICMAAMLSLRKDHEMDFQNIIQAHGLLRATRLHDCNSLALAACQIAFQATPSDFEQAANRTRAFYDGMKARHRYLTGEDDYVFAAMLALSNIDPFEGVERIERIFQRLKPYFSGKNSIQSLAQTIALSGESESIATRVLSLYGMLKAEKLRFDRTYTLSSLGVLALLPVEAGVLVRDLGDAYAYLRSQKGFGALYGGAQTLLLYVAAAVASCHADKLSADLVTASLATGIADIIVTQQTAMMATMMAMSASAAAASSAASH